MTTIKYTDNIIPIMTSNTTPAPYVASASSTYSSSRLPYNAFDRKFTGYDWESASGQKSGWISMNFGSKKRVAKYSITNTTSVSFSPKDWTFEGSHDGLTWDVLDRQSDINDWEPAEKKEYVVEEPKDYPIYRINVSEVNGATYINIAEIEMFEIDYYDKILISSSDGEAKSVSDLSAKYFDSIYKGKLITLSNNNKTASTNVTSSTAVGDKTLSKGKWYWEVMIDVVSNTMIGVTKDGIDLSVETFATGNARNYFSTGVKYLTSGIGYGSSYTTGDIISVLLDMDNGTLEFWKNGVSQGIAFNDLLTLGSVRPSFTRASGSSTSTVTLRTKENEFSYNIPNGYSAYGMNINIIKELASQSEKNFINYGIDDLSVINPKIPFTKKEYHLSDNTVLGSGKTFEHVIDFNRYGIKKITME